MKRLLTIALVLTLTMTLVLTLAGCGGNGNEPAASDTPQAQETAEPAPTEAPTPETTPDPTPEATPDPNIEAIETLAPMNVSDSFFPNIDDYRIPDDIVKKIVGTLTNSEVLSVMDYDAFTLRFEDVTVGDYNELTEHYASSADLITQSSVGPPISAIEFKYAWGFIEVEYYQDDSTIEVTVYRYL